MNLSQYFSEAYTGQKLRARKKILDIIRERPDMRKKEYQEIKSVKVI